MDRFVKTAMRALEEGMNDLHLSLGDGDSVEKDPPKLPRESVTSHTLYLSRQSLKDIPEHALKCTELKV